MATIIDLAEKDPDRPALIFGNGEAQESYAELELRSRRVAHALRGMGLKEGDGISVLLGNDDEFFDLFWGAMRIGLYFTPINWHLAPTEVAYIVDNSDSKLFVASSRFEKLTRETSAETNARVRRLYLHEEIEGFGPFGELLADAPQDQPLENQREGATMLYSSGTTGFPKGVRSPLSGRDFSDPAGGALALGFSTFFGLKEGDRYLCPAPLYHAAPLMFTTMQHRIGGTGVVMRQFEAADALEMIQDQRVTTSQWVPTHFKRLLQLPEETRKRFDTSSLGVAIHAAAPCPIPVKHAMIDWWGPVLIEYYAGTEGGGTIIRSEEWLEHPGSVGRHWAGGNVHILDEEGQEVTEPEIDGAIYFEASPDPAARFKYYKDDAKTESTYRDNLFTLGDIGHKDADGYLFLTDRQSNMIISGGVNIYPQETENCLISHPKVHDVAIIGVPNEEMGEAVKAVLVPAEGCAPGPELEAELMEYTRSEIAHYKCPRSIDFVEELPRTPTGKLLKRKLKEQYWEGRLI